MQGSARRASPSSLSPSLLIGKLSQPFHLSLSEQFERAVLGEEPLLIEGT